MSYFDDASLVMIPSGTKTSKVYSVKPIDGTGDLTFSRSNDTATRVNSAGLIEKVRTNLILQSQAFNTTWLTNAAPTITANTTVAPDGTTTADTIASTATSSGPYQIPTVASGVEYSFSVYIKNITNATNVQIGCDSAPANGTLNFNAVTGAITSTAAGITGSSVTNAGNGWYRVSGTYVSTGTTNTFIVFGQSGMTFAAWGAQLEAGVTTDYIATTTAAVSVGPVANVPRLDYLNSSCPKLQMEPQRVNLIQFSEIFDNAWWAKSNSTISSNAVTSPDGYTNADNLVENTANSTHGVGNLSGLTLTAAAYTFSVFVKKQNRNFFAISTYDGSTTLEGYFNINTGAVATMPAGLTGAITNYGNGWYRCSVTRTMGANSNNFFAFNASATDGGSTYLGTGVVACSIYGGSLELGSYATSYIPTLGSSSTRGVDLAVDTAASSLIGQTEGTIYAEVNFDSNVNTEGYIVRLDDTSFNDTIIISRGNDKRLNTILRAGGSTIVNIQQDNFNGLKRVAFAYKSGSFAVYVDGVQVGTSAATYTNGITYGEVRIGGFDASTANMSGGISKVLLFKTRLTNAQLAELTTL